MILHPRSSATESARTGLCGILDKDRKIAYIGAVDDDTNSKQVKQKYARDALDALLAGKEPSKTKTEPRGCTVKYEKR